MSEDLDSSDTDSTGKSTSSERSWTMKRKRSNVNLSDPNEALLKRIEELETIVRQGQGTPCKTAKVANEKTPSKNTPKNYSKSTRKSMTQRKSSCDSNNVSKSTDLLEYDCKLCEVTFKYKQARNIHYTGTHKVVNEKLLFFPDGTGLVESTLEHHLRLKLDFLKTAARNMSSRVCKLCKVELDMDDLKWHYEREHKVIQMNKVKPLICLKNSDIKIIAEPFRCEYCPRTFDDETRLKMHLLTHRAKGDEMKCRFCKLNFNRTLYNAHVKKEHPKIYLKRIGTNSGNANKDVDMNKSHGKNVARPENYKRSQIKFSCRFCSFKCSSPVALRQHRQSIHKGEERLNKGNKKTTKCQNNNVSAEGQVENNNKKDSEVNSTSDYDISHIAISPQAIKMYLCEACDLATTSYDEAVSHSQDHILNIVNDKTTLCEHCDLKFSSADETHKELHMIHSELDIDSFQCITYDHKLLFTDKWFDMFDFLPEFKIKIIAEDHSVYFSTRCIRFKLPGFMNNSSAPFFLFQCMTCRNYVDPYSIESHTQQQSCSVGSNSHPCEVCQRPFYSDVARIQHSDTHKVPDADSKYRTILFNDQSDLTNNELLLRAANKSVPKRINQVITTGNIATQVEANKQTEGSQDDDKAKENNDPRGPEKLVPVYKCRCGLCFHTLQHLYDHLQKCSNTLKVEKKTCKCGLVFDSQHYPLHHKVHCFYTAIVVKEVTIMPLRKINIRGMVEEFKNNTELVNKVTTANYVKPSKVMVDDNKCSQEPTLQKDKVECITDTQHKIKEKLTNPKCHTQEGLNKSPPKIDRGPEIPKKRIKMQNQHDPEITVLPNESDTSAEKPKNSKVISVDEIQKVISMYNYIKDAMKNKSIIVTEPQTAMEVAEDERENDSNNTPDDSSWRSNARNKEENRSLVATTIEVEDRNQRANIVESKAKEIIKENTSVKISESGVNTELEDDVAKEKHNQTATQDVDELNIKRNSGFKRNSAEMHRDSLDTSQRRRRESEVGRNLKNNPIIKDIKSEPVESDNIEYNEEELLKDYDEEDYTLCPDIVDLLTDDEN